MNVDKLAMRYEQLKNKTRKHSFITLKDNRSAELECCRKILKFEDNIIELEIPCGIVRIIGIGLKFKGSICRIYHDKWAWRFSGEVYKRAYNKRYSDI